MSASTAHPDASSPWPLHPAGTVPLRSGLPAAERRHMPTLFTLIITWLTVAMGATVLGPYVVGRYTDSYWSDSTSILLWSSLCAVSAAHGVLVYLVTFRRGWSAWSFMLGAVPGLVIARAMLALDLNPIWGTPVFPLTLVVVSMMVQSLPMVDPIRPVGILKALDRGAYAFGNLWWGISQLTIITATIIKATLHESRVGGNMGNEAAYAAYYNSIWFGLLCVLFFVTLYCATMRKWPFRISQIGWLCVHTGLLSLIVGCLAMHWGGFEGRMQLFEGETDDIARSAHVRELKVKVPAFSIDKTIRVAVDQDPEVRRVIQQEDFTAGGKDVTITIDQYYSTAEFYSELADVHAGAAPGAGHDHAHQAGVEVEIKPGDGKTRFLIEESQDSLEFGSLFAVFLHRMPSERMVRGYGHRYAPGDRRRGKLVVSDVGGVILAEIEITPPMPEGDGAAGVALSGLERTIAERGITVRPVRYFDYFSHDSQRGVIDASPGEPTMPGLVIEVTSNRGTHKFAALANGQFGAIERGEADPPKDIVLDFDCVPELPLRPSSMTLALGPEAGKKRVIIVTKEAEVRIEPFEIDRTYRLSGDAPISLTPKKFFDAADVTTGFRQVPGGNLRAIRVNVTSGGAYGQTWLVMDIPQHSDTMKVGGMELELAYSSRRHPLGFSLSCLDFREFRYANSTKPKAYETNVVLREPQSGIDETVLIDMNKPLDFRGFRVFNQSPIFDTERHRRGVVFQITRNPGYGLIIIASIIVTIGLVIVFAFKPALRRIESRRNQRRTALPQVETVAEASPRGV